LTAPAPKKQRQSEEYLFDVVQNIEGALYLCVTMPSSGHFLGCEFFSDTRQANFHVRYATIAPGEGVLQRHLDAPGPAVHHVRPPALRLEPKLLFSLPLSLALPGSPAGKGEKVDGFNACGGITQGNLQAPSTTQAF
jgi:hypothetical protein